MFRRLLFLSFMSGAIGVPYLLSSSSNIWTSVKSKFSSSDDGGGANTPDTDAALAATEAQQPAGLAGTPQAQFLQRPAKPKDIEGAPAQNLAEILHFNGTPDWVVQRWPRVTTGLAHPELQGYRVPLVTGTAEDDLAGSLTYYFDGNSRVEYITFHGVTGDPRKIIALVMRNYGFQPERTDDPRLTLYMVKWNGKPVSELRIETARVLRADQPNLRYRVDLALKRPT